MCTSAVAFEIPDVVVPYISVTGDGSETSATEWVEIACPLIPCDITKAAPMRANHNRLMNRLAQALDARKKLPLPSQEQAWQLLKDAHLEGWNREVRDALKKNFREEWEKEVRGALNIN